MNSAAARSQTQALALRFPSLRANLVLGALLLGFLVLILRSLYLQGLQNDFLRAKGDARYKRALETSANRGKITDRNGEPLAISTPVESVWASPADVEISREQAVKLGKLVDVPVDEIQRKVTDTKRDFVYVKRHLDPEAAAKVMSLKIPGLFLRREYRRYYPAGDVMSHMLGFTDVDDKGQEGLELAFQEGLEGKPGSRHVIRDRKGHIIEDVESIREPQDGKTLVLAIDQKIQYLAFRELKAAIAQHKAKAGAIVVLDARSGELLALANFPTYNPNNRGKLDRQATRNRAITDLFEPGSTIKPITAATALEAGKFRPDTQIQTSPGQMTIGKATIHDAHPNGLLTVAQVIQKSSNVGAAKIALALPAETLHEMFKKLGFGDVPNSGFPGEAAGRVRNWKNWVPIEQATMSYGHGISVSLLQLARAYTIFAGDGELKSIVLTKQTAPVYGQQVITPETSKAVRAMLELAVQPGGTAPKAQVVGYRVAGKTGTAHKLEGNGYADNRYVSSFVGLAPATDPRLVVAVMIDEPSNGQHFGGAVAAPVFSNVMAGALRLMSVPPDAPTNRVLIPADTPEVKEMI